MVTARLAQDGKPTRWPRASSRLVLRISLILHDAPMITTILARDHEDFWLDEEFWVSWPPEVFIQPEVFIESSP
jgi:hypothetical protein